MELSPESFYQTSTSTSYASFFDPAPKCPVSAAPNSNVEDCRNSIFTQGLQEFDNSNNESMMFDVISDIINSQEIPDMTKSAVLSSSSSSGNNFLPAPPPVDDCKYSDQPAQDGKQRDDSKQAGGNQDKDEDEDDSTAVVVKIGEEVVKIWESVKDVKSDVARVELKVDEQKKELLEHVKENNIKFRSDLARGWLNRKDEMKKYVEDNNKKVKLDVELKVDEHKKEFELKVDEYRKEFQQVVDAKEQTILRATAIGVVQNVEEGIAEYKKEVDAQVAEHKGEVDTQMQSMASQLKELRKNFRSARSEDAEKFANTMEAKFDNVVDSVQVELKAQMDVAVGLVRDAKQSMQAQMNQVMDHVREFKTYTQERYDDQIGALQTRIETLEKKAEKKKSDKKKLKELAEKEESDSSKRKPDGAEGAVRKQKKQKKSAGGSSSEKKLNLNLVCANLMSNLDQEQLGKLILSLQKQLESKSSSDV